MVPSGKLKFCSELHLLFTSKNTDCDAYQGLLSNQIISHYLNAHRNSEEKMKNFLNVFGQNGQHSKNYIYKNNKSKTMHIYTFGSILVYMCLL